MRKVLVFQHVANKILGTLNPTLKDRGLNMRYVNFDRTPDSAPSVEKYNGLIVLGGHMGVYEAEDYTHIKTELRLIEEALKKDVPILGICLGAQLLAHVLGANVRKHHRSEIGWCPIQMTEEAANDPLFSHFKKQENIFQLHGDTFDIPQSAIKLAQSEICPSQAFRYGNKAYGMQFHLEADFPMILRWLDNPRNQTEMFEQNNHFSREQILNDTTMFIEHSQKLSTQTFNQFINLFDLPQKKIRLGSL